MKRSDVKITPHKGGRTERTNITLTPDEKALFARIKGEHSTSYADLIVAALRIADECNPVILHAQIHGVQSAIMREFCTEPYGDGIDWSLTFNSGISIGGTHYLENWWSTDDRFSAEDVEDFFLDESAEKFYMHLIED